MSCSGAGDEGGGIRVRRDTQVTVEACRNSIERRRNPPVTTTIRSGLGGQTASWQQRSRAKSLAGGSRLPNTVRDKLRSDALSRMRVKRRERDITEELIDFFRKTSPPPGSQMSRLTTVDETHEKKSKRLAFWPFRKKRRHTSSKWTPGLIKLPDSAVAGTTIGGHRYIAISIPVEYAHLSPAPRSPASPQTERTSNPFDERQAQAGLDAPERQDWDGKDQATSIRDDTRLLPYQYSNGATRQETAGPPQARFGHVSVGAHNTTPKPLPELTALPQGSSGVPVEVRNGISDGSRHLRHKPVIQRVSAHDVRLPDAQDARPTDWKPLNEQPSIVESSHTTGSELICSDAETVHIPTPRSTAEASVGSDESRSYHTAVSTQSPLVDSGRDSTEGGALSMKSSAASDLSALYDPSTSWTSSLSEFALPHPILFSHDFHQPHALSAITSVESPSPTTSRDTRTSSTAPVVAVDRPSPSSRTSFQPLGGTSTPKSLLMDDPPPDHTETHRRHIHSIPEMLGVLPRPGKSPLPGFHPQPSFTKAWETPPRTLTPIAPTASSSPATKFTTNPYPSPTFHPPLRPPPRTRTPPRRTDSHRYLLHRYEVLSQTRARELESMLDRLEKLEHAHERWMKALAPVLERATSRRIALGSRGDGICNGMGNGNIDSGASSGASLRLRLHERSLRRKWRSHCGGEGSFDSGVYSGGGGTKNDKDDDNDGGGGDGVVGRVSAARDEMRIVSSGPTRFDSLETARKMRSHYCPSSDERLDGLGEGACDGQVNVNDQSRLRSEPGSATWSVSASGELVMNSRGRRRRRPEMMDGLDSLPWRSMESLGEDRGSWRTTFGGRQPEAFARDQQRWRQGAGIESMDDEQRSRHIGDPKGLDDLESVMRDLVLGSRDGYQSTRV
ncbi:hypothetical protein N657DRAFT_670860 [Parathielavia appendiculata]|uniref:Uncharacterized protein n=1 Tax=Parathielavia appendiculata TaxID=2587402 RepID=A0AAN6U2B9_9PEZI|nr:hypothetical protein N657DRAFT_670860 [Parathielavia appendiculata]